MTLDVWISFYQSKKPIPQKSIFSTARFQSEKNLPYGSVFLLLLCVEKIPIFQGYWRYYLSIRLSRLIFISNFIIKIIKTVRFHHVMLCKNYCVRRSQCAKKSSHMGGFFCLYCVLRKFLNFRIIGDIDYPRDEVN